MAEVEQEQRQTKVPSGAAGAVASAKVGHPLLAVQRSAGNRAAVVQARLRVGRVDDPAEREADRVAAEVMRSLQGGEVPPVRRSAVGRDALGGQDVSPEVQARIAGSSGRPMDGGTLSRMESAFGASFSGVRIHDGAEADTLSRSLQAEAFTTGSDVFFRKGNYDPGSSGGQELLAHELTHVVQQGGGVDRKVRRFVDVKTFAAKTNEGTFTAKGTAQKEIEKLLTEYAKLGAKDKKGKVVVRDDQLVKAIDVLLKMQSLADEWWDAHTIEEEDANAPGGTKVTVDPSRRNRAKGFEWFRTACAQELAALQQQLSVQDVAGTEQAEFTPDERGKMKLEERYTGGLKGGLALVAKGIEKAVPKDGDSTEFNLDLKVPVQPGVFVGALLKLEAEKDDGTIEVGAELAFQAGGSVGIAEIAGAIGGYVKAGAKTGEQVMKLVSYGFYRRCAESNLPYEVQALIWGGGAGEFNRKKADTWSLGVEKQLLGEGEGGEENENYVELGGLAKVKAGADVGVAEVEGEAQYSSGRRYDAESLKNTKGKAGEKNKKSGDWFTQNVASSVGRGADAVTGRSTHNLALSAEASVLGGALKGAAGLEASWRASGKKGENAVLEDFEVTFDVTGKLEVDGFTSRLVDLGASVAKYGSEKIPPLMAKAEKKAEAQQDGGVPTKEIGLAADVTQTTFVGVTEAPLSQWASEALFGPSSEEGLSGTGSVGVELGLTVSRVDAGKWERSIELRHVKGFDIELPEVLEVELVRKSRIFKAKKETGGAWTKVG